MVQHSHDNSRLNGVKCINLNCKKLIQFRTLAMDNTERITTLDQHWFNKTVHTQYMSNIHIPAQAYTSYADILSPMQQPSIILKCNLNAWRDQHTASMIIFDNRLLNNWSFNDEVHDDDSNADTVSNT